MVSDLSAVAARAMELVDDEDAIWNWAERAGARGWMFRGQREVDWPVRSSLERCARRMQWERPRRSLEIGIYRRFQRHAHLFVSPLPTDEDVIEWLALIRHFGAPTRLVDWTYSFHIALFFAARAADPHDDGEDRSLGERCAAVWAIDAEWLDARALDHLRQHGAEDVAAAYRDDLYVRRYETFGTVYNRSPAVPFVLRQNCWRLNERLVAQQGVFLCPGDVERDFEENLAALVRPEDVGTHIRKLVFPKRLALAILRRAYRSGISLATMYPGLEGFVRSLGDLAAAPEVLSPSELDAPLGRHQPGAPHGSRPTSHPRKRVLRRSARK
ncbi:FRG domain-containing protein [Sandaracinus amylolyticus]|uniref:FRG domain-containing protein n=1 Tax=Sandaracinus amylolyticus TaxID=927083 RepID=UPI001F1C4282|nr:FRG domain-containing protein [Sandaracinus amylolyticus]